MSSAVARTYRRDRLGRFAATPGQKVTSALAEAERALARAEHGVDQIAATKRAVAQRDRRTVRRSAMVGAAVGALVPAPASVKASTATAALYGSATTAAGAKMGKAVGQATVSRRSTAGTRVAR